MEYSERVTHGNTYVDGISLGHGSIRIFWVMDRTNLLKRFSLPPPYLVHKKKKARHDTLGFSWESSRLLKLGTHKTFVKSRLLLCTKKQKKKNWSMRDVFIYASLF